MAKRGGSATCNGVLYQILGTLGHAVDVTFRATSSGDDLAEAMLLIEPVPGGGDVHVTSQDQHLVEQWKSRPTNRTWSLAEIIDDVLPDLYKATPTNADCYRFVTGGRRGKWEDAYNFFRTLGEPPQNQLPSDTLDDQAIIATIGKAKLTKRQLFSYVVRAVAPSDDHLSSSVQHNVWHLLSRFEMQPPLPATILTQRIEQRLRAFVDHIEDVREARLALCGRILELASTGNIKIRPEDLLKDVHLTPKSFLGWSTLRERLHSELARATDAYRYDPELDVRPTVSADVSCPVTFITGETGQGKSWHLAALAHKLSQGPCLVVWVPSTRSEDPVEVLAATSLWCTGLDHDRPLALERVIRRKLDLISEGPDPWAIICVDGVHNGREADRLTRLPWADWGVRLVMAGPPEVAEYLTNARLQPSIARLSDFSSPQLREYVRRRGITWGDIPQDMREVIRRPILAQFYCDLAKDTAWSPRYEYDLMQEYWNRIGSHPSGAPQDFGHIRALAYRLLEAGRVYPWTPEILIEHGVPPETVNRLVELGWLKRGDAGTVEVWHDRLMCWAVAESLYRRCADSSLTTEAIGQWIKSLIKPGDTWERRLGYVPMDVLWLMADPQRPRPDAWKLIEAMEVHRGYGHETQDLYQRLLPTLGPRIAPVIIERLRHLDSQNISPFDSLAATTLLAIARTDQSSVRNLLAACLEDGNLLLQQVALRISDRLADPKLLDRIWDLHRPLAVANGKERAKAHQRYQIGFKAIEACLQLDSTWLDRQLGNSAVGSSELAELVFLLARTPQPAALSMWTKHKQILCDVIQADKRRSLVNCIVRFRDAHEFDRLSEWVGSREGWVGGTSLAGLAYLDPTRAVEMLADCPIAQLRAYASEIRSVLAVKAAEDACAKVRELAAEKKDHRDVYFGLVNVGDRVDAETVGAMIGWIDELLVAHLSEPEQRSNHHLGTALAMVAGLRGRVALGYLKTTRGSTFEENLARAACSWVDRQPGLLDRDFEAAKGVLLKVGGDGFTQVVNALLRAKSEHAQREGCELACIRPDKNTKALVASLAHTEPINSGDEEPFPIVQQAAIDALAAMGEDTALISAILGWGGKISPDVAEHRAGRPPMSDEAIGPAVAAAADSSHERHSNGILALSVSQRLDLRLLIKELFLACSPSSSVAFAAMLALEKLGGYEADLRPRLIAQYKSGHHKNAALRLMSTAGEEAVSLMAEALPDGDVLDSTDERVIVAFAGDKSARLLVRQHLRKISGGGGHARAALLFDGTSLLDPADPEHEQWLWQLACSSHGGLRIGGAKSGAIERLGETQPDAAFEMAWQSLCKDDHDYDDMLRIMLNIDLSRAVPMLVDHACTMYSPRICRSVATALRTFAQHANYEPLLQARLNSHLWTERRSAAELIGYLSPDVLGHRLSELIDDEQPEVRVAALTAVRRRHRETEASFLSKRLHGASPCEAWAIADDVMHLVDPNLIRSDLDPLGFRRALADQPYALRHQFTEAFGHYERTVTRGFNSATSDLP